MTPFCQTDLKSDEGCKLHAYQDTLGVWTVGYGHAGVPAHKVWSQSQADLQFIADFDNAVDELNAYLPWWKPLNDPRQDVLANMTFNLGIHGLLTFHDMLLDCRNGDFTSAAQAMLESKWARQLPNRSGRLATQMRTGLRVAP